MGSSMTATIEATSSRRQPVRATRINPARTADDARDEVEEEARPEFLPGITHFTDTLAALPKEMVRHSTMLKETEAKLYAPEQDLRAFLFTQSPAFAQSDAGTANLMQRHCENACAIMASMLGSLDEKNHVLSTANETLDKLLAKCESAWPLIEQEISEDTRRGRSDHWAYTDRTTDKKPAANVERASRRNLESEKAAALLAADLINSKSSKGHKRVGHDAPDAEDASRKSNHNKRKPQDTITGVGLGIGPTGVKRRKVEKPAGLATNGGHAMEKSLSTVFRNVPGSPTVSAADIKKKGKSNNGTAVNGRRRAGTTASNIGSPSMISSPVLSTFAMPGKGGNSPKLGTSMARTTSSRARAGPTSNPGASNRPNSAASTPLINGLSYPDEKPTMSRTHSNYRVDDHGNDELDGRGSYRSGMKREESNSRPRPPSISTAARNNGKASKTGTPVMGSFPDTARPRSGRNSTTTMTVMDLNPPKRSHKKKEPAALQRQRSQQKSGGARTRDDDDSDEPDELGDAEQLYCYCNGPSHGEMVACDMPGCEKEWFHLECVGLTKPPPPKSKWFCPDCRPKQQRIALEKMTAV